MGQYPQEYSWQPYCHILYSSTVYMKDKQSLKNRISKIKGQIEGVERMIDEDRDSLDIVQQVVAINSALKTVGIEILKNETETCVSDKQKFEVLLKNLFKLK